MQDQNETLPGEFRIAVTTHVGVERQLRTGPGKSEGGSISSTRECGEGQPVVLLQH
jgi:hypothetical protein